MYLVQVIDFSFLYNAEITDFIEQTEDRILPSNFKEIPERRTIENDDI